MKASERLVHFLGHPGLLFHAAALAMQQETWAPVRHSVGFLLKGSISF